MSSSDEANNSDNEQNENSYPSGDECLKRCKNFAELTGTDSALAMFYLQDVEWDLNKALDAYYSTTKKTNSKVVACFDMEQLDKDEEIANATAAAASATVSDNNGRFKVLSWNIDGLDKSNLESRTTGVINVIKKESPDAVFFQEVIPLSYKQICDGLNKEYDLVCGVDQNNNQMPIEYFTMILIKKSTCKMIDNKKLLSYENSCMGRNLLKVKINYKNQIDLVLMTTHLESTADFSKQRVEQLKKCFDQITSDSCLVIFGGDLNIRDKELQGIGGLPKGIYDLWESTGSRKECLYTWDCTRNTNLTMNGRFKPRCRFDRLFYKQSKNDDKQLIPVYFELEGLEKLKSCSRFCSDHWAIQCYFELSN